MNDELALVNTSNEDYRHILATANKLATLQSNLESVLDFFLTPTVKLYHSKLCSESMKLLFESEFNIDYYRKAEELVWRRIYHDIYRFQKSKRDCISEQDACLVSAHFISGIGFYSTLIIKLRYRYDIQSVQGVIEPLNFSLNPIKNDNSKTSNKTSYNNNINKDENSNQILAKEWATQAIYRSIIYMGDLARYLLETNSHDYRALAFNFYRSASRFQPDYGLPYNQLATLAGDLNYNLHAVSNYMRCCLKPKPFDRAEGNMRKLFELNEIIFHNEIKTKKFVSKISDVLSNKDPSQASESMVKAIIVMFIKLTSDLWSAAINGTLNKNVIIEETHLFFETLREALELEPIVPLAIETNCQNYKFHPISAGSNSSDKPRYISSTIIYEFCCTSMMLITKCQNTKPSDILIQIEPDPADCLTDLVNTLALNLLHYSTSKCYKMVMSRVQKMKILKKESLECSLSKLEICDTIQSENKSDHLLIIDNKELENVDILERNVAMSFIYSETYLPTIKIFCDWLLANSDIISLNLESFCTFCSELEELNGLLRELRKLVDQNSANSRDEIDMIYTHIFDGPSWIQKYPLSCDFPLYYLKPLQKVHELNIDFKYLDELNDGQAGFIILQCVEAFLYALSAFLRSKHLK